MAMLGDITQHYLFRQTIIMPLKAVISMKLEESLTELFGKMQIFQPVIGKQTVIGN